MKRNSVFLGCAATLATGLGAQAAQRPNVLLIISDDTSYIDYGCYGSPDSKTPNIDRLATQGMQFMQCYQAVPMSSPTRHCLYTGLYPVHSGAYPNHTYVPDGTRSFVQYFGEAGYRTALYAKTHVSPPEVFSYEYLGDYDKGVMDYGKIDSFMKSAKDEDRPFFLVVASHEAHSPWTLGDASQWNPEEVTIRDNYVDTPETRDAFVRYLAEINVLDKQVGNVLRVLDDNKLGDDTIVVFLSEQGNSFPFAKWTCYNQGLHSGCLVRWPGVIEAGSRTEAMVEYVDILPTLLDMAGVSYPVKAFDGRSFKKVLQGKADEHKKYSFGEQTSRGIHNGPEYFGIRSVNTKRYRYIRNFTPDATFRNMVVKSGWWKSWLKRAEEGDQNAASLSYSYLHRPAEELYDIQNDPSERHNLIDDPAYAKIRKELVRELDRWMKRMGDKGQETEMEALDHMEANRLKVAGKQKKEASAKGSRVRK